MAIDLEERLKTSRVKMDLQDIIRYCRSREEVMTVLEKFLETLKSEIEVDIFMGKLNIITISDDPANEGSMAEL